ncbi:MAG: hypothetical protein NT027_09055 [Proteobacteria bacterium]|nr:hypothetical protein [Pseudomonadota bacterium]
MNRTLNIGRFTALVSRYKASVASVIPSYQIFQRIRITMFYIVSCMQLIQFGCSDGNRNFDKGYISSLKNGDPFGKAIDTPNLFKSGRTWGQTRSVINFQLSETHADQVQEVSVYNSSISKMIIDKQTLSLGLTSGEDESYEILLAGNQLNIKMYPGSQNSVDKFSYGKNSIVLLAVSPGSSKKLTQEVVLKDFTYFGPIYSSYLNQTQASKPLSGGLTGVASGVSSNGSGFLITNPEHVFVH